MSHANSLFLKDVNSDHRRREEMEAFSRQPSCNLRPDLVLLANVSAKLHLLPSHQAAGKKTRSNGGYTLPPLWGCTSDDAPGQPPHVALGFDTAAANNSIVLQPRPLAQ
eukprot:768593-Hanusia_phi.AAC.8